MVKKFTVPCDFSGKKFPITFYIGNAAIGNHPIGHQSKWLSDEKGGTAPKRLMDSLSKLKDIADRNKLDFEELCSYVIDEINSVGTKKKKKKKVISSDVRKKRLEQIRKRKELENKQLRDQKLNQDRTHE